MNQDTFRGGVRHLKGRVQSASGGLTGNPGRQMRGAANQVAGGVQYAYGRARHRAEDLVEDGTQLVGQASRHGRAYGRQAIRYAEANRTATLLGLVAAAFAVGWLSRPGRN